MVSINQLVDLVERIAGVRLTAPTTRPHRKASRPQQRQRARPPAAELEPSTSLLAGLEATYR